MNDNFHDILFNSTWSLLGRGTLTEVWSNGTFIKRGLRPWSNSVHQVLRHLENSNVGLVPRVVFTNETDEFLTFLQGDAIRRPWPKALQSTKWMLQIGSWLRDFHEATRGFNLTDNTRFAWGPLIPKKNQIITHGDLGPWNMLECRGKLTGIIDWDLTRFGYDLDDLTEVAFELGPLRRNQDMLLGNPTNNEIYSRLVALCLGYKNYEPKDLIKNVELLIEERIQDIVSLSITGNHIFSSLVEAGIVSDLAEHLQYFRHRFDKWL